MRSRLLTGTKEIAQAFGRWCERTENIRIVTAWATTDCMACEFLEKARSKISTMVVGLDFYTTSPSFLESFLSVIRIGKAPQGGTFHPKLYLFEIADRFGCVMGSSNFTRGGFGDNAELNICIEGKESDAFFRQVEVFIEEQEKHSDPITAPEIAARKWAESGLAAESEALESVGCIRKVFQTRSRGDRSGEFQDRETSRYCRPG